MVTTRATPLRLAAAGALDWAPLAATTSLVLLPRASVPEMSAALATHAPLDGLLIAPDAWTSRPPRPIDPAVTRPLPLDEDQAVLEDDDAWADVIERGLRRPWFWLVRGLDHLEQARRGSITLVLPRRVASALEGPDEAVIRATIGGFLRAASERTKGSAIRVNLVELGVAGLGADAARTIAWLASDDARAVHGQIISTV